MKRKNTFKLLLVSLFVAGSWLMATAQKGTLNGTITDASDVLIGANISIAGTSTGTVSDVDGTYSLNLDPGSYTIVASYTGYQDQRATVSIAAGETVTMDFTLTEGVFGDEVIIIGTRSAPRTQLETAVPVDVIGARQLNTSAQANLSQILQYAAPSFHSTPQTISDGTDHIDPAALRGLGPDQTLVLVNGKRRHTSSLLNVNGTVGRGTVGTDLNSIPASAIQRIEVLRDGAAAQYGSDAIAGVINIVLKEKTDQVSVNFQTGITAPNAFGGPDLGDVPEELVPEFDNDGQLYQLSTNFGFDLGKNGGFVNVTAEYTDKASTNRSGNYTGSIYPAGYINTLPDDQFYKTVQENTGFVEKQVMEIGNSAGRNAGVYLNAALPLNESGAELYSMLGFNYRNGLARGFYRFPSAQGNVVPQLYPQGFSPQIQSDIFDNSFILGARGKIGEWDADMSQTRGENSFDFTIKNSVNASLGQGSPRVARAGGFSYSQNTSNIDLSRQVDVGFPINVAFGGEFRLENYQIFAGEEASYVAGGQSNLWIINGDSTYVGGSAGIQVFPGFQPQNALDKYRNSVSLYADFEFEFTEQFLLAVAGRYENYSDFGDNFNWKVAGRYKLADNVSVRASVSTGFRAPSLHQIYFNNLSTQFVANSAGELVPVQVGTFNNESAVSKAFGIKPLTPETSTNFSAGLTTRPAPGLSITLDGYLINIDDRIVVSGQFSPSTTLAGGVVAGDILTPLGAGAAQFFTNAVSTKTRGIDVVASYVLDLGNADLRFTLAGNFTETEVDKKNGVPVINTSDLLKGKEDILFNREEVSRLEVAQPKSKVAFSVVYEAGKFSALLRATRFGEITYIDPSSTPLANSFNNGEVETLDQVFSPKIVPDLEVSYQLTDGFKWSLGAHNFTNTYPDLHQHSTNNSSGRFLFSRRVQQFGVRGMYLYTKVGLTF